MLTQEICIYKKRESDKKWHCLGLRKSFNWNKKAYEEMKRERLGWGHCVQRPGKDVETE